MSTEHQKYSTTNQAAAIARYAAKNDLVVVRTYQDEGKSGLRLQGRVALQQLLTDILADTRDFEHLLVYDVSRWGRFQDLDESAHYEFLCKNAGLTIHYCAEEFTNDGSMTSSVVKSLKRAMAAEYSRELSTKVFAGQSRLARLGFRVGGSAGYGLRRLLVDEHGSPKLQLQFHENKYLTTDRVLLVPGPGEEIEVVRRIFRMFVKKRLSASAIARILNRQGLVFSTGHPWNYQSVYGVLKNEKYIGNNLYARFTQRLRSRRRPTPPEVWVRAENCFEAIVDRKIFAAANRLIRERRIQRANKEHFLKCARALLRSRGELSQRLIEESVQCPDPQTYRHYFGGLFNVYKLLGYKPRHACCRPGGKYTKGELIIHLREVLEKEGRLSRDMLRFTPGPGPRTYERAFGSLYAAYELVGYKHVHKLGPRAKNGRLIRDPKSATSRLESHRKLAPALKRARQRARRKELMRKVGNL